MTRTIGYNSYILSLSIQRHFRASTRALSESALPLSSGLRINRSADDAAGLAVADALKADRHVFRQGVRNINAGISHLHIADAGVGEMKMIVHRLKELAAHSSTGTLSNVQRSALDLEFQSLAGEYNRIAETTSFNGKAVFSVEHASFHIQAGYGTTGSIPLTLFTENDIEGEEDPPAGIEEIRRISLDSMGNESTGNSSLVSVSADGRYSAFYSAGELVPGAVSSVYLRDNLSGELTLIGRGTNPHISADGRYVAFTSHADDLVAGDTNGTGDAFVYDRDTQQITRVSVASDGTESNSATNSVSISPDGRYVIFVTDADNLVADDTNGVRDVFVHDRTTERPRASASIVRAMKVTVSPVYGA